MSSRGGYVQSLPEPEARCRPGSKAEYDREASANRSVAGSGPVTALGGRPAPPRPACMLLDRRDYLLRHRLDRLVGQRRLDGLQRDLARQPPPPRLDAPARLAA